MHNQCRRRSRLFLFALLPLLLFASFGAAQTRPTPPMRPAAPSPAANAPAPDEREVAATQSELIKLLRLSPTLTTVVAHDPSLLSNQDYVAHNNPQLAEFLTNHPEVARNPEFYLFSHLNHQDGEPDEALQRAVWPEYVRASRNSPDYGDIIVPIAITVAFACFLAALVWMIRALLENRRWNRIFKLQSEVHGRLIDKFSSNQELATYMETEAGKRFLEAAPIPVNIESSQSMPNTVARVLTPLQIGIVLVLLGIGFLLLRHANPDMETPMLVLGTVVMMPGIGFIISAGITWVLAARLGLMPQNPEASGKFVSPYGSREQH
ncbi:MAG: hypothetical protein WB608_20345 [Terracidiphilus sp.]